MGYKVSQPSAYLEKRNISAATGPVLPNFETYVLVTEPNFTNEDNLQWEMTSKY